MRNTTNYAKRSEKAIYKLTAEQYLKLAAQMAWSKSMNRPVAVPSK